MNVYNKTKAGQRLISLTEYYNEYSSRNILYAFAYVAPLNFPQLHEYPQHAHK